MSVLVKGWSISTNGCCGCSFRTGKYCGILDKNERVWEHVERYTRPSNCPLVEVPTPHGGLIDVEQVKNAVFNHLSIKGEENLLPAEKAVFDNIIKAPTVIEAEE